MSDLKHTRLGVLGAGNMAEALVRGVLSADLMLPAQIVACDPAEERRAVFSALGIEVSPDNTTLAGCDLVLLSVKPQIVDTVLESIGEVMKDALLVTIAAGVRTQGIARQVGSSVRIVRVMPNTPMLVGQGAAAVAAGPGATQDDVETVLSMFGCAGIAVEVDESLLDAVTALSGSGPAYVFRFVEALAEAGEQVGLSKDLSRRLARQTVVGAGMLLAESDESAAILRDRVTSKGGTTEAALRVWDERKIDSSLCAAVKAAKARSEELARTAR